MTNRRRLPLLAALVLVLALALACQDTLALAPDYVCEAVELTPIPLGRKLIIAHRGATAEFPENTREALLAAANYGIDSVELDVVLSSDGVPVVIHDYGLARMTDCSGDLRAMPWELIEPCRVGGEFVLPRLDDLLPALLDYRKIFVEIKCEDDQAEEIALVVGKLIDLFAAYDRVVVTSFNLRALYTLKTRFPEPRIHIGYDGADASVSTTTMTMGFDYMLMRYTDIDRCVFAAAERMGVKLVTYTVEDRDDVFAVASGLFRAHAYGVMVDNAETWAASKQDLEAFLGETLPSKRSCKEGGRVWDPDAWTCVDPCIAGSCPGGAVCDEKKGLCRQSEASGLAAIAGFFDALDDIVLAGQAARKGADSAAEQAARDDLVTLLAPAGYAAGHVDTLAALLFGDGERPESPPGGRTGAGMGGGGTSVASVDWDDPVAVRIARPHATVTTAGGTEWFLTLTDAGWRLNYLQTW